jgi:hypothetical protein
MRCAKQNVKARPEYRITSLQNDHNVRDVDSTHLRWKTRKRAPPGQHERDRLFQSPKQREKSRDALLHVPSNDKVADSDPTELAKLRVEKAQLLSACPRKVRKRAAFVRQLRQTSSVEADIILEKSFRPMRRKIS